MPGLTRLCRVPPVALRKESVDRNVPRFEPAAAGAASLSARRAWIEISNCCAQRIMSTVALRKESVDRNLDGISETWETVTSLSARRAWIEITALPWLL